MNVLCGTYPRGLGLACQNEGARHYRLPFKHQFTTSLQEAVTLRNDCFDICRCMDGPPSPEYHNVDSRISNSAAEPGQEGDLLVPQPVNAGQRGTGQNQPDPGQPGPDQPAQARPQLYYDYTCNVNLYGRPRDEDCRMALQQQPDYDIAPDMGWREYLKPTLQPSGEGNLGTMHTPHFMRYGKYTSEVCSHR